MEKQKKKLLIALCVVAGLDLLTIILVAAKAIGVVLFIPFFIVFSVAVGVLAFFVVKLNKKIKEQKAKKVKATGNPLVDIYTAMGIPIQYNLDGSIKDIYELLGIEPEFDENGNRILTVYEKLGILPRFGPDGKEIPSFLVIKNRVARFAKVDLSKRVLTRKLTEAEKEEKIIKETLKKKIDEAEKQGDKQKAASIKKVLANKNKSKPSSSAKKKKPQASKGPDKPKYAIGKAAKAIKAEKIGKVPNTFDPKDIIGIFSFAAFKSKPGRRIPMPQPQKPPAEPIPEQQPQKPQRNSQQSGMSMRIRTIDESSNDRGSGSMRISTEELNR